MAKGESLASTLMSIAAVACAVIVTAAVVRRELGDSPSAFLPRSVRDYSPVPTEDWNLLMKGARRIGPDSAVLTIVEFGDFQCPACRRFHEWALRPLIQDHPEEVALVFRHWPLPYHRDAYGAARAAECGADQGRFLEMIDALYSWQDSIGHALPEFFARAAAVPDLSQFDRCAAARDTIPSVNHDIELATRLGGNGTPTLIVNGQILRAVPDSLGLRAIFEQAKGGDL